MYLQCDSGVKRQKLGQLEIPEELPKKRVKKKKKN